MNAHSFARVAHASRALVLASRQNNLPESDPILPKVRDGETPSPTRETRALPRRLCEQGLRPNG